VSTDSRTPTVWSFFTGAMGLDLGLEQHGLEASLAVEKEPIFCETIRANRPEMRVLQEDVTNLTGDALRGITGDDSVDLMVGGPPCQSFCPGGARAALRDPRGNLIFEYLRLIAEVRPQRFVLENVSGLITAAIRHRPINKRPGKSWNLASYNGNGNGQSRLFGTADAPPLEPDEQSGSAIRYLLETAVAELGYAVSFAVLDASHFGSAQRRLRLVLLGDRDGPAPPLPQPTHGPGLEPIETVRDAIGDLEETPGPGSQYTAEVREVFDLVPPGGNWRQLPKELAMTALGARSYAAGGGKTGFFRRLSWDAPAPTITGRANRKGSALCHPSESRPLSVRECARIQGFPDDWQFAGSMNRQYIQVGNAVPVALGAAIGTVALAPNSATPVSESEMLEEATQVLRASARNKQSLPAAAH
jgi:DNA (cytosine-5)-methyltransferase 1